MFCFLDCILTWKCAYTCVYCIQACLQNGAIGRPLAYRLWPQKSDLYQVLKFQKAKTGTLEDGKKYTASYLLFLLVYLTHTGLYLQKRVSWQFCCWVLCPPIKVSLNHFEHKCRTSISMGRKSFISNMNTVFWGAIFFRWIAWGDDMDIESYCIYQP